MRRAFLLAGLLANLLRPETGCGAATLVPAGSIWRYLDNGSFPGTNWASRTFNDATWAQGPAQLGYGDGDEATVVGFGAVATNKHVTTYFRHAFVVTNTSAFVAISVDVLRDDGVVVYLNGREIIRNNMPAGAPGNRTFATSSLSGASETAFVATPVSPTNLVAGTNLVAVEIHQSDAASSDVSFDLRITGLSQAGVSRGPYLQMRTADSAMVRWRTDAAVDSRVVYGVAMTNLTNTVAAAARTTEHALTLTGLRPETRYYYAVCTSNAVLASGTNFFFVTAPSAGAARPVRVWALGDSGTADANARAVRDAYAAYADTKPVDVWLMLGDNAYNAGTDAEYQAAVFETYPAILRNTFLWSTIGNHETDQSRTATSFPYLDLFSLPSGGEAGGVASGTEKYYSFDHANVHFICLDSMTSSQTTNGAMMTWLRADLEQNTRDWTVVFFHHPPYTKGSHDSDTESDLVSVRTKVLPVLESHGVDLVLCGHSHSYERSYLLNGHYGSASTFAAAMKIAAGDGRPDGDGAYLKPGGVTTNSGTVYVVAGSSGKMSGGPLNHPAMVTSLNRLGSLVIDVNANRLDARFLDSSAAVLDHFAIVKTPPGGGVDPAQPACISMTPAADGLHQMLFAVSPATPYRVEFSEDLLAGGWQFCTNLLSDAAGILQVRIDRSGAASRVYRVVKP